MPIHHPTALLSGFTWCWVSSSPSALGQIPPVCMCRCPYFNRWDHTTLRTSISSFIFQHFLFRVSFIMEAQRNQKGTRNFSNTNITDISMLKKKKKLMVLWVSFAFWGGFGIFLLRSWILSL